MFSRRSFFRKSATLAGAASLTGISSAALAEDVSDALLSLNRLTPEDAADEEDLWARMAQSFTVTTNIPVS